MHHAAASTQKSSYANGRDLLCGGTFVGKDAKGLEGTRGGPVAVVSRTKPLPSSTTVAVRTKQKLLAWSFNGTATPLLQVARAGQRNLRPRLQMQPCWSGRG